MRAGILVVGGLQGWAERYGVSPDGVSYLNLSDGWASGDWRAGINGYWSPLYPAVLGVARALVHPSLANEALLLHAVNFIFLALSLVGFEMLLSELRALRRDTGSESKEGVFLSVSEAAWWDAFMYGLFAWAALELIGVGSSTPDMFGAAVLYFGAALTLRCHRAPSPGTFAAVGLVLGLGYLAKRALLAIGALWVIVIAAGFGIRSSWRQRLLAMAAFLAVSLPLAAILSIEKGRLTFGDAGKINRAWYVNKYPMIWTGLPPGSGKPVHPAVVLNEDPRVIAYPGDVGSSYPFFDDPSYWNEGMIPKSDLRLQALRTVRQVRRYAEEIALLVLTFALLSVLAKPKTAVLHDLLALPSLTLSMLALLIGYFSIITQARFIGPSAVILLVLGFDAFRRAIPRRYIRILAIVAAAVSLSTLASNGGDVIHQVLLVAREISGARVDNPQLEIATALSNAGLERGDKIGALGSALEGYWARLAGLRIVVEVPSRGSGAYWVATDSVRSAVDAAFWRSGIRAIVAARRDADGDFPGWEPLPVEGFSIKWPTP